MKDKFNVFKYIDFKSFLENGIDYELTGIESNVEMFMINPYSSDFFEIKEPKYSTYSKLNTPENIKTYESILIKYISLFNELFKNHEIYGFTLKQDKLIINYFYHVLSMKKFIIKGAEENTSMFILIDDMDIFLNFGFDLTMAGIVFESNKIEKFYSVLANNGLYLSKDQK